jgi:HD-GYP domain-containing protein (c-di-GMP phosphodiesterase class II)
MATASEEPPANPERLLDRPLGDQRRNVNFDPAQFGMAAVSLELLHPGEESPADFFLPLFNLEQKKVEMSPACLRGEVFKSAWRDRLLQANQVTVYVPLDQAPDVTGFFARMATAVLGDPNRPLREKRQVVREVACLNLQTIFSADISSQALKQSLRQTQDLVGVLGGDPQLLKNMGDLLRSDSDLFNHCVNVCMIAMAFGRFLKLPEQSLQAIGVAGMLHDMGYGQLNVKALKKHGDLTQDEWQLVRQHPRKGYQTLMQISTVSYDVLAAVTCHHENWDGSGYPGGLAAERIPQMARILRVVDAFDAMTSDRPHRPALKAFEAAQQILEGAGSKYEPRLAAAFLRFLAEHFVSGD